MTEGSSNSRFSSGTRKAIDEVSEFVTSESEELSKVIEGVRKMGNWSLFRDSKVPQDETRFWIWFNLKFSDPDVLEQETDTYLKAYTDIKATMRYLGSDENDVFEEIEEIADNIYDKLSKLTQKAQSSVKSTDSRTLMLVHQEFVAKHDKLENLIRTVESRALRQKQRQLTKRFEQAVKTIEDLTRQFVAERG